MQLRTGDQDIDGMGPIRQVSGAGTGVDSLGLPRANHTMFWQKPGWKDVANTGL